MSERRRLVYSIIQFVQEEIKSEELSDDAKESLEVTICQRYNIIQIDMLR